MNLRFIILHESIQIKKEYILYQLIYIKFHLNAILLTESRSAAVCGREWKEIRFQRKKVFESDAICQYFYYGGRNCRDDISFKTHEIVHLKYVQFILCNMPK